MKFVIEEKFSVGNFRTIPKEKWRRSEGQAYFKWVRKLLPNDLKTEKIFLLIFLTFPLFFKTNFKRINPEEITEKQRTNSL